MSEESNRLVTDLLSDYLFTPSEDANQNLINEGHSPEKIFLVGNTMIDSLVKNREAALKRQITDKLGLEKKNYAVLTLHRYNNIDVKPVLKEIFEAILEIQKNLPVVFPLHPSTFKKISGFFPRFSERMAQAKNLRVIDPIGYLDMISLLENSKLAMTDSGGVQEETTFLGIPCLTLRNNTERPVTVLMGTNVIAGTAYDSILSNFEKMINSPKSGTIPPKWDGKTNQRILEVIKNNI
jgi:UDP-N-acetylglucosamine 2-epimerase (non-hydrolysing)